MIKIVFSLLLMMTLITSYAQNRENRVMTASSESNTTHGVPFLTHRQDYMYVDKANLNPLISQSFKEASIFTSTGFAVVRNERNDCGVIDAKGTFIFDFSNDQIDLQVVNGLTFYKKVAEYEKKMPLWMWEWNILGGSVKKEQTYHTIEIGIIEFKQVLLKKDLPYMDDNLYLNIDSIDRKHIFWNGNAYEIINDSVKIKEREIAAILENQRYLKGANGTFAMFEFGKKKAIYDQLSGRESLSLGFGDETIRLEQVNKERVDPEVPKLLAHGDNVYVFPQYDKAFPKEIKSATASQLDFIKKTSLVYSITNSPYFLLGVFNSDDNVWAYEWLYIDINGHVIDHLNSTYQFRVTDQVGNLVWPDRKMILPDQYIGKNWKFGKINNYSAMQELYLIRIEDEHQRRTMGLWNSDKKMWEIKPAYNDISILDLDNQLYAIQKEPDGLYTLYDQKYKKNSGSKGYRSISSDGLVSSKLNSGQIIYYYIDLFSGKEYKEN